MNKSIRGFLILFFWLTPIIIGIIIGGIYGSHITEQVSVAHFASNPYQSYMSVEPYHPIFEYALLGFLFSSILWMAPIVVSYHKWVLRD